ncbi:MAG: hypothetical protein Q9208_000989 [Pyrenodesmia sp. 3 TL-2023]
MPPQSIPMHSFLIVALTLLLPLSNCASPLATAGKFGSHPRKLDLSSLNNVKTVKAIIPQAGELLALPASELTAGKTIKLQLPSLDILAASRGAGGAGGDFDRRMTDVLNRSVPQALREFGIVDDGHRLADEGVPLLKSAVEGILSGDTGALVKKRRGEVGPRGSGFWDWVKGAGCAVFATAALPAYLVAAADLAVANGDGQRLNQDLMYHTFPVHGDLALSAPVTVYYQAVRPPAMHNAAGITMNRDVYIINPPTPSFTWQQYNDIYPQFLDLVKLLRHELQHVKQYHENSYNLVTYAHRYLFAFCTAGSYSNSPLEQAAVQQEHASNTELVPYSVSVRFFLVWRTFGLIGSLGYPTEEHHHQPGGSGIGTTVYEKTFKSGVLQLRDQEPDGTYCFRTFSTEEIYTRDAKCTPPTVNPCNKMRKRAQDHRTHDRDGNPLGGEPGGRERCRHRKTCEQLRKEWSREWASLSRRAWRCGFDVP